jgi:membrane protein YqaA with SNARE-associated domain
MPRGLIFKCSQGCLQSSQWHQILMAKNTFALPLYSTSFTSFSIYPLIQTHMHTYVGLKLINFNRFFRFFHFSFFSHLIDCHSGTMTSWALELCRVFPKQNTEDTYRRKRQLEWVQQLQSEQYIHILLFFAYPRATVGVRRSPHRLQ